MSISHLANHINMVMIEKILKTYEMLAMTNYSRVTKNKGYYDFYSGSLEPFGDQVKQWKKCCFTVPLYFVPPPYKKPASLSSYK